MPLSIRRAKVRICALRDTLEVGETWDCGRMERAVNFAKRWDELALQAPKSMRSRLPALRQRIKAVSPTFKRIGTWPYSQASP